MDAVYKHIQVGRDIFEEGIELGVYNNVSRKGQKWMELDLHSLSLGAGEIAVCWWFDNHVVPHLQDADIVKILFVTGRGRSRDRVRRYGDDGMRLRCRALLGFLGIKELSQSNMGLIDVEKRTLMNEVQRHGGRLKFDLDGYLCWKKMQKFSSDRGRTSNHEQKIRARFHPSVPGSRLSPFVRVDTERTSPEYRHGCDVIRNRVFYPLSPRINRFGQNGNRRDGRNCAHSPYKENGNLTANMSQACPPALALRNGRRRCRPDDPPIPSKPRLGLDLALPTSRDSIVPAAKRQRLD